MPKWLSYALIAVAAYLLLFRRGFGGFGVAPIISPQHAPPAPRTDNTGKLIDVGGDLLGRIIDGAFSYDSGGAGSGAPVDEVVATGDESGSFSF